MGCMAFLHFGSLCCRARGMSVNGCPRSDQHVWRLSGVRPVPSSACFADVVAFAVIVAASAVVLEGCRPVVTFAVADIVWRLSKSFWRHTAWPHWTSARSAVVLKGVT